MIALAAITLSLQIARTTLDPLDGVNIEVAVHNTRSTPETVTFPQPQEYAIDVLRGTKVIFSTLRPEPPGVTFPPHARTLPPGPSVLVVYIWNALADDGGAPGAGTYTVRARLLGEHVEAQAQTTIRFTEPTPVSALAKLKLGDEVTIAGRLDAGKTVLSDSTGSITLGHRLSAAPDAPICVRGYVTKRLDGSRGFYVERWAPLEL
ncbi:MAG: hypothetical protein KGN02_10210 [bacterium]|nr:hypothetical protein [bacterium]